MRSKKYNQFNTVRGIEQKKVIYVGSSDTAIKILYRILELDEKNKTTTIYNEAKLVQRLANALEKVIDQKKYENLTDEHKIVVIEAIASELHVKSKKCITNVVNFERRDNKDTNKSNPLKSSGLPCLGISYNHYVEKSTYPMTRSNEYYSVQFPNYFYMGDLVLDIKQSLHTNDKLHLILLAWSYDGNSFFAQAELPRDVMHTIGTNMVDLNMIVSANILLK